LAWNVCFRAKADIGGWLSQPGFFEGEYYFLLEEHDAESLLTHGKSSPVSCRA
jgi:hypothetical protein